MELVVAGRRWSDLKTPRHLIKFICDTAFHDESEAHMFFQSGGLV